MAKANDHNSDAVVSVADMDDARVGAKVGVKPSKKEQGVDNAKVDGDVDVGGSRNKVIDIDDRLPYRQGWPLLPVLPVQTSLNNIPKVLSPSSTHFSAIHDILELHSITVHGVEVAHRYNAGTTINKHTLTLCILSSESDNAGWADAIRALRIYIQFQVPALTLSIEVIDHRIYHGVYTLPILPHETSLTAAIKKKRHGVVHVLDDSGLEWTSLEFWWRGMGPMRENCKPTVLIGTPVPQREVWWGEVREKVQKKMGGKWTVEVCFREVVKY